MMNENEMVNYKNRLYEVKIDDTSVNISLHPPQRIIEDFQTLIRVCKRYKLLIIPPTLFILNCFFFVLFETLLPITFVIALFAFTIVILKIKDFDFDFGFDIFYSDYKKKEEKEEKDMV